MEKHLLPLVLILFFMLNACKKDKQVSVTGISSVKSVSVWHAVNTRTGFKPLATKDTLFIIGQNGEENIVIAVKQKGTGTYGPAEIKAWFFTTIGLDVVVSKYQLEADAGNAVVITAYDVPNHTLKGTFNLSFRNTYKNYASIPDAVKFTNGVINTQLSVVFMDPYR